MKTFEIAGTKREGLTKQHTKQLRDNGQVPCVLYGDQENLHFSVPVLGFRDLVYTPEVYKVVITVDGKSHDAVMKEVQFHPVSDKLIHIDFMAIHDDKVVTMHVPVRINGTSEGQKQGGKLVVKVRRLQLRAMPTALPEAVDVDVTNLGIGQSIRVSDLKIDGVEFLDTPNNVVAGVRTTRNVVETPAEAAKAAKAK